MTQLVMCIDARGTPVLRESQVYTAAYNANCGCRTWIFIEEAMVEIPEGYKGHHWYCCSCLKTVCPDREEGRHFFLANRFIPLNKPDLKEEPEKYENNLKTPEMTT